LLSACGERRHRKGEEEEEEEKRGHLHLITAPAAHLLGDYIVLDTV